MFRYHASARACTVNVRVNGEPVLAPQGASVATALLGAGHRATRDTPVAGRPRGPWCLMGSCFDCLVTIDGVDDVQACLTPVREGMSITLRRRARDTAATTPERDPWEPGA